MKELSKTLTGKKIRDEMLKRKMTVRDLQDALELDSPQSIYKWLRGESLPSLPNMLVLGELFKVPLETLTTVSSMTAFLTRLPIWSRTKMTFP